MRVKTWIKRTSWTTVIAIVVIGTGYLSVKDNIHTVVPQVLYRSAQLDKVQFAEVINDNRIQSIINLRGKSTHNRTWYQNEIAISKALDVKHFDIRMSAHKLPKPKALHKLVSLLQLAPRPMLVHCRGGADRTGLASAIAKVILENAPIAQATEQFSWKYLVSRSDSVGKLFFPLYQRWLSEKHLTHSRQRFMHWANTVYPAQYHTIAKYHQELA